MRKIYVVDTNVPLHDSESIFAFEDNEVVIPFPVLREINNKKTSPGMLGKNARTVIKTLDSLRAYGKLSKGVDLPNGGLLRVETNCTAIPAIEMCLDPTEYDNKILATAYNLQKSNPDKMVILVTKDADLRVVSDIVDVVCQDYQNDKSENHYTGISELSDIPQYVIDSLYSDGFVENIYGSGFQPNEFVILKGGKTGNQSAISRFDGKNLRVVKNIDKNDLWEIKGRNREQKLAIDLLLDDSVKLVTMCGQAGTGKTLLALAAGLQKTIEEQKYKRIIVARPHVLMGKDHGALPGDLKEKLMPLLQPIFDNLDLLFAGDQYGYEYFEERGQIQVNAIAYMRGRSIPKQWVLIDEAQNLTPKEIKTIVSRIGKDSKLVVTGDPDQIDHPYLDANSNGLVHLVERMKSQRITGHISLEKCERSELAELGAKLL